MAIPNWLHLSQNSGNSGTTIVTVTADTYTELTARTSSIIVKSQTNTGITKNVSFTQYGRGEIFISVSPSAVTVDASGGTYTVNIVSNGEWTATTIPSWATLSQVSGSGNTTVTIEVDSSSLSARTSDLIFSTIDASATVTLTQEATVPSLSINPTALTFDYTGGSLELTIISNYQWSITAPSSITLSQNTGTGNTTITVSMGVNYYPYDIIENISITDGFNTVNCTVTEDQWGGSPYYHKYLTLRIHNDGVLAFTKTQGSGFIWYSMDDGNTWNYWNNNQNVSSGDVVMFKGDIDASGGVYPKPTFSGTTAGYTVEGNVTSIYYVDSFIGNLLYKSGLQDLFVGNTGLTSAENLILPATTLSSLNYAGMFRGCTSLTTAPELPATTLDYETYAHMFSGCTSLTTAPELPATTLGEGCYYEMFLGCSSLRTVPSTLPATTLATPTTTNHYGCYEGMFQGCTSLRTVPALPATQLTNYCYQSMFLGCSSLTTAPVLSATNLAESCYRRMFEGCTLLTTAPVLSATTLASSCYRRMFEGCSSLTTAPALPATTLASYCYEYMFRFCSSLTTAPELPATTLVYESYFGMFYGCTNLSYIKCLATTISTSNSTKYWVDGVSSFGRFIKDPNMNDWSRGVDGIPVDWLVNEESLIVTPTELTFNPTGETLSFTILSDGNCTLTAPYWISLSTYNTLSGKTTVYATASNIGSGSERTGVITVSGRVSTVTISVEQELPVEKLGMIITSSQNGTITVASGVYYSFDGTIWTESSGESINVNTGDELTFKANNSYVYFQDANCTYELKGNIMSLVYGDNFTGQTEFDTYSSNLGSIFNYCTGLTSAENLKLPAKVLKNRCYFQMFKGCTSLTTAPELPATTLASACYEGMFAGCTSLTTAPELPATTLLAGCYNTMFQNCSSLNYIKCLATNYIQGQQICTGNWVSGVSATGTFVKNPDMSSWPTSSDGIPYGWTVQDAS